MPLKAPKLRWPKKKKTKADDTAESPEADTAKDTEAEGTGDLTDEEILEEYRKDPSAYKKLSGFQDRSTAGRRKRVIWRNRILLILLALVLLVTFARCSNANAPDMEGVAQNDDAAARAFAVSYVSDWYTWSEETPENRGIRLAEYNPAFSADLGWDGNGTQTVKDAVAVDTESPEDSKYVVLVRFTTTQSPTPQYAEVALYDDGGTFSPLSLPSVVPAPRLPVADRPEDDRETSNDREEIAVLTDRLDVFFDAWASGDTSTLDAVTTNEGPADPIGGDLTFKEMRDVTVYTPSSDDTENRTVRATVTWTDANGAEFDSVYEVDMENTTDRWLVADVVASADDTTAYVGEKGTAQKDSTAGASSSASATPTPTPSASASASATGSGSASASATPKPTPKASASATARGN